MCLQQLYIIDYLFIFFKVCNATLPTDDILHFGYTSPGCVAIFECAGCECFGFSFWFYFFF